MEISGLIVTVGQGAGYRTVAAGLLLITGLCRRLTLSLVWRLVTALAHRRQSTVCSAPMMWIITMQCKIIGVSIQLSHLRVKVTESTYLHSA